MLDRQSEHETPTNDKHAGIISENQYSLPI